MLSLLSTHPRERLGALSAFSGLGKGLCSRSPWAQEEERWRSQLPLSRSLLPGVVWDEGVLLRGWKTLMLISRQASASWQTSGECGHPVATPTPTLQGGHQEGASSSENSGTLQQTGLGAQRASEKLPRAGGNQCKGQECSQGFWASSLDCAKGAVAAKGGGTRAGRGVAAKARGPGRSREKVPGQEEWAEPLLVPGGGCGKSHSLSRRQDPTGCDWYVGPLDPPRRLRVCTRREFCLE